MIELPNERMIELWKSNKTYDEIAKELGIDRKIVHYAFRRLKDKKLIPPGDRPRSRQSYARGDDGRTFGISDDGTMLERLRKEHPERDPQKHDPT